MATLSTFFKDADLNPPDIKKLAVLLPKLLPVYLAELKKIQQLVAFMQDMQDAHKRIFLTESRKKELQKQIATTKLLLTTRLKIHYDKAYEVYLTDCFTLESKLGLESKIAETQKSVEKSPPAFTSELSREICLEAMALKSSQIMQDITDQAYEKFTDLCGDDPNKLAVIFTEMAKYLITEINDIRLYWIWGEMSTEGLMMLFTSGVGFDDLGDFFSHYDEASPFWGSALYTARLSFDIFTCLRIGLGFGLTDKEKELTNGQFSPQQRLALYFDSQEGKAYQMINDAYWGIGRLMLAIAQVVVGAKATVDSEIAAVSGTVTGLVIVFLAFDILFTVLAHLKSMSDHEQAILCFRQDKEEKDKALDKITAEIGVLKKQTMTTALHAEMVALLQAQREAQLAVNTQKKLIASEKLAFEGKQDAFMIDMVHMPLVFTVFILATFAAGPVGTLAAPLLLLGLRMASATWKACLKVEEDAKTANLVFDENSNLVTLSAEPQAYSREALQDLLQGQSAYALFNKNLYHIDVYGEIRSLPVKDVLQVTRLFPKKVDRLIEVTKSDLETIQAHTRHMPDEYHDLAAEFKAINKDEYLTDADKRSELTLIYIKMLNLRAGVNQKNQMMQYERGKIAIKTIAQTAFPWLLFLSFMHLAAGPAAGVVIGVALILFAMHFAVSMQAKAISNPFFPDPTTIDEAVTKLMNPHRALALEGVLEKTLPIKDADGQDIEDSLGDNKSRQLVKGG